MTGVHVRRAVMILLLLVLVVEGYFTYQWYDRYYGSAPDTASGGQASPERTTPDGASPEETTAKRGVPSDRAETVADRDGAASRRDEAEYVDAVGEIQSRAVETFLGSHDKLLRYDALAAADVEEMKANETALQGLADRATSLTPPQRYEEQHEVFGTAVDGLRDAAGLAHGMAADPVAVDASAFDEYDRSVKEASDSLLRSNELVGEDYETIGDVREVSPEF